MYHGQQQFTKRLPSGQPKRRLLVIQLKLQYRVVCPRGSVVTRVLLKEGERIGREERCGADQTAFALA